MTSFEAFNLKKQLRNAIQDLGFESPTPIQEQSFSVIRSGKDVMGIAQTGTGKTLAYMLPILEELPYSNQQHPRVLILVPTRELVVQVVDQIELFSKYLSNRVIGIYGGVNINTQKIKLMEGSDIVVATPGRLYDLVLSHSIPLKHIKKLVIDEVDVMLDLGFRMQVNNLFELMPERRQNILYSATMTDQVEDIIDKYFTNPEKISIAVSGTPLDNIHQTCYPVKNFYTKVNLLKHLLEDKETYHKVLVFVSSKRHADLLFEAIESYHGHEACVMHSNKSQNYRLQSIEDFDAGYNRILISTDVMSRGIDLSGISHVINFDTPEFPENYMHRIGRTGRAEHEGQSILFYTGEEKPRKRAIEELMQMTIEQLPFPEAVEVSTDLISDERKDDEGSINKDHNRNLKKGEFPPGFHPKKERNLKKNKGGSLKAKKEERLKRKKYKRRKK